MGPTKEELLKSLPIPGTTVILAGHCLMLHSRICLSILFSGGFHSTRSICSFDLFVSDALWP